MGRLASFFSPITALLSAISTPITESIKGKQAIKKAITDAKIKNIEAGQLSDIELDKIERQNAGWMDDISFAIFLIPAVLAFFPPATPHIKAGFAVLEGMPQWYQVALGMMLVAVWGYRKLVGPMIESLVKVLAKRLGV